jgi:hypothetical protein
MEKELGEGIPLKRWNEKGFSFQRNGIAAPRHN